MLPWNILIFFSPCSARSFFLADNFLHSKLLLTKETFLCKGNFWNVDATYPLFPQMDWATWGNSETSCSRTGEFSSPMLSCTKIKDFCTFFLKWKIAQGWLGRESWFESWFLCLAGQVLYCTQPVPWSQLLMKSQVL